MSTPYAGNSYIWHWKGDSLAERTIEEVVRTLKKWAPHVKGLYVKTSDGSEWMGEYDKSMSLGIRGPHDVANWARIFQASGLEFHAWCVPKGKDIVAEADIIVETATIPGVRSMIIDVEGHLGFWQGGRDKIQPFMTRIRRGVGGDYTLGMSVDPRPQHMDAIFPDQWRPFFDSLHPQMYWELFDRPLDEVIDEAYDTWQDFGLPIYPVFQGNANPDEMDLAIAYAIDKYEAESLSWWRLGAIGPTQFQVVNTPITRPEPPDEDPPPLGGHYGEEILITPQDPRFLAGAHSSLDPKDVFESFPGTWGWEVLYKETRKDRSTVWARWDPQLTKSGWYEVSAFVSARHATTTNARYKLHGVIGQSGEMLVPINQNQYNNLWVSMGIFKFDANNPVAGIVFLNDLTGEADRSIVFDAVRYRQIVGREPDSRFMADGYDSPVGTAQQRRSPEVWPGHWQDAGGYAVLQNQNEPDEAYHTGADLNLNMPYQDADAHSPVYAAASGVVTFAGRLGTWGNVIVIRHDPLITSGQVMYSRSAHVEDVRVIAGDRVQRGQQIARVGDAAATQDFHLHFDLSPTERLATEPWDWPRTNLARVKRDYVDPRLFIEKHRPV